MSTVLTYERYNCEWHLREMWLYDSNKITFVWEKISYTSILNFEYSPFFVQSSSFYGSLCSKKKCPSPSNYSVS